MKRICLNRKYTVVLFLILLISGCKDDKDSTTLPDETLSKLDVLYYVDGTNGSDSNKGTISQPFLSIDKAIQTATEDEFGTAGIFVRKGIYYLSKALTFNFSNSGILLANYEGEDVTIKGTKIVEGWKKYSDAVYVAKLDDIGISATDIKQVFFDGGNRSPTGTGMVLLHC